MSSREWVFASEDRCEYDAPAPTERHPKEDLDEFLGILRCHIEDLSPRQQTMLEEIFFEHRKRAEVAERHGISVSTYDNHLQAAFRAVRASMEGVVNISCDVDCPSWYDRIEDLLERRAARH